MYVMRKVFLVDDEKVIRQGIADSIEWEKEGFEYCGDASDGEVALPLIEKSKPDIVITDIKMPFMDGLQLSKILYETLPDIKIIILSGHDEFEYAREAMRVKVSEYCLKPVSAKDLLEILHNVSTQLDLEEIEKKQLDDFKKQALQNTSFLRKNFLAELCDGLHNTTEAIRKASELDLDVISSYYYVLILESEIPKSSTLIKSIIENHSCLTFDRNSKETIFIFKGESNKMLEHEAVRIRKQLLHEPGTISFGIGKIKNRIQGIAETFAEANVEKNFSLTSNKRYNSTDSEVNIHSNKNKHIHQFNRNDLVYFLKFGIENKIPEFSRTYSAYLQTTANQTPFYVYYFLMDFTITVVDFIKEQNNDFIVILDQINTLEVQINWIKAYHEIVTYMEEMLHLIITYRERINSKFGQVIQKTKDYIHDNYNDQTLSLQTIAKQVNVSASYLSNIFSKETGQTLIEYLTNTRIEYAKVLLKTTNNKTYEIAHSVGYGDSQYFCHTFKKQTGMTTKQFKLHTDTTMLPFNITESRQK